MLSKSRSFIIKKSTEFYKNYIKKRALNLKENNEYLKDKRTSSEDRIQSDYQEHL
jgi:hypothetical protein